MTPMLISAVAAGLLLGVLFGGHLRNMASLAIRWPWLLGLAIVLRLAAPLAPLVPLPFYLASFSAILVVVLVNRGIPGMPLIGIGALSNLAVVALNGGMPVDLGAVAVAGASAPHDPLHLTLDAGSRLGFLADVIPVALVRNVYSAGDILVAAGGFWLPFVKLRAS